jgi:hypothetical protein
VAPEKIENVYVRSPFVLQVSFFVVWRGCWLLLCCSLHLVDSRMSEAERHGAPYLPPSKPSPSDQSPTCCQPTPTAPQSFVYGDSLRSQLVAVVVPDPEYLLPWAKDRGWVPAGARCLLGCWLLCVHHPVSDNKVGGRGGGAIET